VRQQDWESSNITARLAPAVGHSHAGHRRSAREFANEYLFAPLGASQVPAAGPGDPLAGGVYEAHEVQWARDPRATTRRWGLVLKPRDMARFGYLYLMKGSGRAGR